MLEKNQLRSRKRRGALTLEWILLVTVLVIGIIGGLAAVRNATTAELLDLAEAISAINVGGGHGHGPDGQGPCRRPAIAGRHHERPDGTPSQTAGPDQRGHAGA